MQAIPKIDNTVTLRDGRRLGYAEYGAPQGKPILYFHGWPSSRLEAGNFHAAGAKFGARIVGIDRPGLGLSDFKQGFAISQWPEDVLQLAEALSLERFAVVGISSGAPYAFACAHFIPQRLIAAGSVSGVGPLDIPNPEDYLFKLERQIVWLAQKAPWLARLLVRYQLGQLKRDPAKFLEELDKDAPEVDKAVFQQHPELAQEFARGIQECGRSGTWGVVASIALEGKPWGFRLEEIGMKFHVWHGELDNLAYPATARYLAERLPDCVLTIFPNEAHLSTVVNRAEEIVGALVAA